MLCPSMFIMKYELLAVLAIQTKRPRGWSPTEKKKKNNNGIDKSLVVELLGHWS